MIKITVTDSQGNATEKTVDLVVDEPTPTPTNDFYMFGISSSRQGLNAGESHKRQATVERYNEMAQQLGTSGAALRAVGGRHVYDTNNAPVGNVLNIGVVKNCVDDGFGVIMLTSSRWSDMGGAANGNYDATIKSCLRSMSDTGKKFIWNVKHEPSNNGMTATEEAQWRKLQARMAWLVAEHNDPKIYYSDCHIPMAAGRSEWNWVPELKALRPNDWQAINARTYLGLDPYPEVGVTNGQHVLQTIQKKCGPEIQQQRNWGRTGPICLPEVGLFNWCIAHSETYTLTAAQQAQRLYDELWVWGQANNLQAAFYYDVADLNDADVRDSSRTLDTPAELEVYGKLVRGDYR